MAGKKQFDTEAVLSSTTDLFRRKGYLSSSVDDFVQHTGVGRSSLPCAEFAVVSPEVQGRVRDGLAEQEAQLRKFFQRAGLVRPPGSGA